MSFYTELSDFYDIVFPIENDTIDFLSNGQKPEAKILDLACGTGDYSIALAKMGYKVHGIDLNGDMIKKAKEKANGLDVGFTEYDMTRLNDILKDEKYDLIFCIGNSLVHLITKKEIEKLVADIYSMLSDNGTMIIQIINFDRIFKHNIKNLPTIEKTEKGITFVRRYDYESTDTLKFNTEIIYFDGETQKEYNNTVSLIPIFHKELANLVTSAGFKRAEFYGGFSNIEYSDESYALVIKAFK